MQRRHFVLGAGAALAAPALAMPAIAQSAGARVLRFVPQATSSSRTACAGRCGCATG
jgi:hypothetical protein